MVLEKFHVFNVTLFMTIYDI